MRGRQRTASERRCVPEEVADTTKRQFEVVVGEVGQRVPGTEERLLAPHRVQASAGGRRQPEPSRRPETRGGVATRRPQQPRLVHALAHVGQGDAHAAAQHRQLAGTLHLHEPVQDQRSTRKRRVEKLQGSSGQ